MSEIIFPSVSAYSSPFGTDSLFHIEKFIEYSASQTTIDEPIWTYQFDFKESGVEVIDWYETLKKANVYERALIIIYEEDSENTSNMFGTACRVFIGKEMRSFLTRLLTRKIELTVNGQYEGHYNFNSWVDKIIDEQIRKHPENFKPSSDLVKTSILIEFYHELPTSESWTEKILDYAKAGAAYLREGFINLLYNWVESMEGWKFTEENYEADKFGDKLKPILPLKGIKSTTQSLAKGLDSIDNLTTWITNGVEQIFPGIAAYIEKFRNLFQRFKQFISEILKLVNEGAKVLNAFLCGLCNGFISLIQSVVTLLAFAIEKIPLPAIDGSFSLKKSSLQTVQENQKYLELAEDIIDILQENIPILLQNVKEIFGALRSSIVTAFEKIWQSLKTASIYFWAALGGAIVFEIIVEVILALVTGGGSLAAKASAKISRITSKVARKGAEIIDDTIIKATTALRYIRREFNEFIAYARRKRIVDWLFKKVFILFDYDITDLIFMVDYETSFLAKKAQEYRRVNNTFADVNIAVFEYIDPYTDKVVYECFESNGDKHHAEQIGMRSLKARNIPLENVIAAYTEFEPCMLGGNECKLELKNNCKFATIEYSFPYPGTGRGNPDPDAPKRQASKVIKRDLLKKLKLFI